MSDHTVKSWNLYWPWICSSSSQRWEGFRIGSISLRLNWQAAKCQQTAAWCIMNSDNTYRVTDTTEKTTASWQNIMEEGFLQPWQGHGRREETRKWKLNLPHVQGSRDEMSSAIILLTCWELYQDHISTGAPGFYKRFVFALCWSTCSDPPFTSVYSSEEKCLTEAWTNITVVQSDYYCFRTYLSGTENSIPNLARYNFILMSAALGVGLQ